MLAAFNRFLQLPAPDRRLIVMTSAAQIVLAACVRIVSLPVLLAALARHRAAAQRIAPAPQARVAWAIETVGRRLPTVSTCLVRALAAELLLDGRCGPRRLCIGVRRSRPGILESHAWLECDGRIVVGGDSAAAYVRFMTFDTTVSMKP